MFGKKLILALLILASISTAKNVKAKGKINDFPTEARAEYIFACMHSNEISPTFLQKCSCGVDKIANRLSYDEYLKAETIIRIQLENNPRAEAYRSVGIAKSHLDKLFRAMAAAEIECF